METPLSLLSTTSEVMLQTDQTFIDQAAYAGELLLELFSLFM